MKKEIIQIDKEKGIYRVTTLNERWYSKEKPDEKTGLPSYEYYPSVTWKAGYYPKGIAFYKWLANKGWDEAESLKETAGSKGTKVHNATEDIDKGVEIDITQTKYLNPSTEKMEELSLEEVICLKSYIDALEELNPEVLASEITVFGKSWAGTVDRIWRMNGEIWIVDIKTSQYVWEEYKIQLNYYGESNIDYEKLGITEDEWKNRKLAILQVGYNLNRKKYKFTEIDRNPDMIEVTNKLWENENKDSKPKEIELPLILKRSKNKKIKK